MVGGSASYFGLLGGGGGNILQRVCVGVCVASGFPLAQPATGEVEKQSFVLTREQEELRVVEGGRRDTPPNPFKLG